MIKNLIKTKNNKKIKVFWVGNKYIKKQNCYCRNEYNKHMKMNIK
jgi:hypothetical protein